MELMKNLRWMCRLCAVNIKKRRSTESAISIFETPQLCEKLRKYLHIEIEPGDELPKKICVACHKRIESFHSFTQLANKTDSFFKDFINITRGNILGLRSSEVLSENFQSEFASFALLTSDKGEFLISDDLPVNDAGELILNVSINDPLSKDIKNKIDLATKRRSMEFERRKVERLTNKNKSLSENFLRPNSSQNIVNNGAQVTQISENNRLLTDELLATASASYENGRSPGEIFGQPISYDCLNLGSVIKDMDLLKLILKALKWPFTKDSLNAQIQQLKNTRLRDVITDPNLLQDADMTQILRSYLSPVLLQSPSTALNPLSSLIPYKIPADTSVQLISVPSDTNTDPHSSRTKNRRLSPPSCTSPIVVSDDSNDVQMFEVSVDPRLFFPGDKEFFFHQYNNTDSLGESDSKPVPFKSDNPMKVRKKHRKKSTREVISKKEKILPKNNVVVVDDVENTMAETSQPKKSYQKGSNKPKAVIQKDEGFKDFDIDSVTLVEDASGDDEIWSGFKVTESPENSDSESHNNVNKTIKKEVVDDVEIISNSEKDTNKNNENANATENIIEPKVEVVAEEEIIKTTEKESNENLNKAKVKNEPDPKSKRVRATRSSTANKPTVVVSSRITRPKSPRTYYNNRRQNKKNTPPTKRQTNNKKEQKIIESKPVTASPRKSNARKRICKQCGLTFTNITDFVEHRKKHM